MKRYLVLAFALTGCGLKHVPGNVLEQLPYEAKIELLEAENELAVAVDRVDEAAAEIARTKELLRRGKDRASAARDEVNAASDASSKEVAQLAVIESEKRVDYLRARQRLNEREESLAKQNLTCAEARYEVSRLAASRKAKLKGSESLDPAEFDAQLKACEAEYAALREKSKETSAETDAIRAEWDQARAALAKKTFDARASPYVE